MKTHYHQIKRGITKDGSEIRELLHPDHHSVSSQSLTEATVPAGVTHLHRHYITSGNSEIPPDTADCITNTGNEPLMILFCCASAYGDTELLLGADC